MSEDKKTLRVTRTIKFSYDTVWPDHYMGESLAESAKIERELEPGQVIEILDKTGDAKFAVDVEVMP